MSEAPEGPTVGGDGPEGVAPRAVTEQGPAGAPVEGEEPATEQGSRTGATDGPATDGEAVPGGMPPTVAGEEEGDGRWVPLREAAEAAGVSVSALRKAYREGRLPSREVLGPYGRQKLVPLDEVLATMGQHRGSPRAAEGARGRPQAGANVDAGQALELLDGFRQSLTELTVKLADEQERAGRAEERAVFLREQLAAERERAAALEARLEAQVEAAAARAQEAVDHAAAGASAPPPAPVVTAPVVASRRPWWRRG